MCIRSAARQAALRYDELVRSDEDALTQTVTSLLELLEQSSVPSARDPLVPVCQKYVYIFLTGAGQLAISAIGMNNICPPSTRKLNR
jgi:hypothetical protein